MNFLKLSLNLINKKLHELDWEDQTYPILVQRHDLEKAKQEITDLLKKEK